MTTLKKAWRRLQRHVLQALRLLHNMSHAHSSRFARYVPYVAVKSGQIEYPLCSRPLRCPHGSLPGVSIGLVEFVVL